MSHNKCYAICESKCKVETLSRKEIERKINAIQTAKPILHTTSLVPEGADEYVADLHLEEILIDDVTDTNAYFVFWSPPLSKMESNLYLDLKLKVTGLPTNKTKCHVFWVVDGVPKTGYIALTNGSGIGTLGTIRYDEDDFNARKLPSPKLIQLVDYYLQ